MREYHIKERNNGKESGYRTFSGTSETFSGGFLFIYRRSSLVAVVNLREVIFVGITEKPSF